jgi:5'(3')-deoxyribonucleotidase
MAKIGIDCDNVCCDFQKRFVALLNEMYGRPTLDTAPIDWNWSNCEVSKEEMVAAWKRCAGIRNLWSNIAPLESFDNETVYLLGTLVTRHDVYFVTNRFDTPGASPMKQTKHWFYHYAGIESPNVLIAKDKGPMAVVLQLDYFIDDRPKNCIDVQEACPNAKVYLADSSHNKTFNDPRFPRVKDLKEFLKLVLEAN